MNTPESGAAEYLRRYRESLDTMIDEMTNAQLGCSISQNFIMQMIPHHRAAIEMSRNLLEHSRFRPVRCIAENIITSQTKSIENMQSALECCSQVKNCSQELCGYQRRFRDITGIMFEQMKGACTTGCIAADFMREMIPHHRGAVLMSENALQYPLCREIRPMLDAIISSQTCGIHEMEQLLRKMQYAGKPDHQTTRPHIKITGALRSPGDIITGKPAVPRPRKRSCRPYRLRCRRCR